MEYPQLIDAETSSSISAKEYLRQRIARIMWVRKRWDLLRVGNFDIVGEDIQEPICSEIHIGASEANREKPQAWFRDVIYWDNTKRLWYYNYPAAVLEARERNMRIPSLEEWMTMFKCMSGWVNDKAKRLNIKMTWYRSWSNNSFAWLNDCFAYWSWDEIIGNKFSVHCILGWSWSDWVSRWYANKSRWAPLRLTTL